MYQWCNTWCKYRTEISISLSRWSVLAYPYIRPSCHISPDRTSLNVDLQIAGIAWFTTDHDRKSHTKYEDQKHGVMPVLLYRRIEAISRIITAQSYPYQYTQLGRYDLVETWLESSRNATIRSRRPILRYRSREISGHQVFSGLNRIFATILSSSSCICSIYSRLQKSVWMTDESFDQNSGDYHVWPERA